MSHIFIIFIAALYIRETFLSHVIIGTQFTVEIYDSHKATESRGGMGILSPKI